MTEVQTGWMTQVFWFVFGKRPARKSDWSPIIDAPKIAHRDCCWTASDQAHAPGCTG